MFSILSLLLLAISVNGTNGFFTGSSWSPWSSWTTCSLTCGTGEIERTRDCRYILTGGISNKCVGESEETKLCTDGCRVSTACSEVPDGALDCNFEDNCNEKWKVVNGGWVVGSKTPTQDTGPTHDNTFGTQSCGNFIYMEGTLINSGPYELESSPISTTKTSCLSFYINMYALYPYQMGNLTVVFKVGGSNHLLWHQDGRTIAKYSEWAKININIPPGDQIKMTFVGTLGLGQESDAAIDDIVFTVDQECAQEDSVDGNWAPWQSWGSCSVTCGPSGTKRRTRTCTSPAKSTSGIDCLGSPEEVKSCDTNDLEMENCPVKGDWDTWTSWTICIKECGFEQRHRYRECAAPIPITRPGELIDLCNAPTESGYGLTEIETQLCGNKECVSADWASWSDWTDCSLTCSDHTEDSGTKSRSRYCPDELTMSCIPDNEDNMIDNYETETRTCYPTESCEQFWTTWSEWTDCSLTCADVADDSGLSTRSRYCPNLLCVPDNVENVEGNYETESKECIPTEFCVFGWSDWSDWGECSGKCTMQCGGRLGTVTRSRICQNFNDTCEPDKEENVIGTYELDYKECYGDDDCVTNAGKEDLVRNTLVRTISRLTKSWFLSIDIRPNGLNGATSNTNIFHATNDSNNDAYGDRVPMIHYKKDSQNLTIQSAVSGNKNFAKSTSSDLPFNKFTNVFVKQDLEDDGEYYYYIYVDCQLLLREKNTDPQEFDDVNVYASSDFIAPAQVWIRNLIFDNLDDEDKIYVRMNQLIKTIPKLSRSWIMSVDVYPMGTVGLVGTNVVPDILHATQGGNNDVYGDKVPALKFLPGTLQIRVVSAISCNKGKTYNDPNDLPISQWTSIEIKQELVDSKYMFTININGTQVYEEENTDAHQFDNVKLFAGDEYSFVANAAIKNLRYENLTPPDDVPNSSCI